MFIGIGIIITTATRVVWVFAYHFSKVGFRLNCIWNIRFRLLRKVTALSRRVFYIVCLSL